MRLIRTLLFALLVAVLATGTALAADPSFARFLPEFLRPPREATTEATPPEPVADAPRIGHGGDAAGPAADAKGPASGEGNRGLHRGDRVGRRGEPGQPAETGPREEPPGPAERASGLAPGPTAAGRENDRANGGPGVSPGGSGPANGGSGSVAKADGPPGSGAAAGAAPDAGSPRS